MATELKKKILELMSSEEYDGLGELVKLGKKATSVLVNILSKHQDPLMRKRAAIALGRIRDKAAVKPLVGSLSDKDPVVLISVVDALASIGDRKVSKDLVPLLKNKDNSVRLYVVRALGTLKDKKFKSHLEALLDKEQQDFIRREVFDALDKIGGP